jgi:AcrR family transcriptional regulator
MRETARRRALAAMAEAVGERGYADITVRDVLIRARMSRRTFYELFDNREQCFLAAYDDAQADFLEQLGRTRLPDEPWPEHAFAVLLDSLRYLATCPDVARLLVVEAVSAGAQGLERHERTMRELAERLARSFAGTQAPPGSEQVQLRSEATIGALHRVVHARIVEGRARDLPELAPQLMTVVGELAPVA